MELMKFNTNKKRFNWNYELIFFLEIIKIQPKWFQQDIALAFIQKYPYLGLNI
jgi:hypothetical protein